MPFAYPIVSPSLEHPARTSACPSPVKSSTPITENPGPPNGRSQIDVPSSPSKQYTLFGPVSEESSPVEASTSVVPSPL